MRILHVISSSNPKWGGPIEGINQISNAMKTRGHEVEIVSVDSHKSSWLNHSNIKNHTVGKSILNYSININLYSWIDKNIKNFDVIIVNGLWQYTGYVVWRIAVKKNIPYVIFTHGMLDPWFRYKYPMKHLKKIIYWKLIESKVLKHAKSVIFTCEEEKILARNSFNPYNIKEKIFNYGIAKPVGNGEVQKEIFLKLYPELRNRRLILFLSRIHEKKGCDLLIQAFSEALNYDSNIFLIIAGPDQSGNKVKLQSLAAKLGISDKICWPGMLKDDMKWGAFHSAEVFCLSSHQENFGIVVAEALSCGKPVLITNKVNIWREVESNNCGFVSPDTVEGTASNLKKWLSLSKSEYEIMSHKALLTFDQSFNIDNTIESLVEIIK